VGDIEPATVVEVLEMSYDISESGAVRFIGICCRSRKPAIDRGHSHMGGGSVLVRDEWKC
jgi:hypothetical protein